MPETKEVTELYCHECDGYIKIELDYSLNGNHVVECPNCGHEHCRVIENGKVTSDRWDQRNRNSYNYTSTASWSGTSMYSSSSAGTTTTSATTAPTSAYQAYALTSSWANTGTGTGSW